MCSKRLLNKNDYWVIVIMASLLFTPLIGHTQESAFFIDDDEHSIISINQSITEAEVTKVATTEIKTVKAEAMKEKKSKQAADHAATESVL